MEWLTDHRHELICVRPTRPAAIIFPSAARYRRKDKFIRGF
nr:hypothetical protein 376p_00106 [Serratia liquefaciens]